MTMTDIDAWEQAKRLHLIEQRFNKVQLKHSNFWRVRCKRCNHAVDYARLADIPIECPKAHKHPKPPADSTIIQMSFELRGTANDH
jgi:hypothetical protein